MLRLWKWVHIQNVFTVHNKLVSTIIRYQLVFMFIKQTKNDMIQDSLWNKSYVLVD